jgi:diguanylate cyclase (GGDEF)-like protein
LPNRRAFERETERVVRNVARHGTPAAVMFVDVDGLKSINDAWGHAAGDAALRHVATILRRELRATDIVARIGGDEFGLLLDHLDEASARTKGAALLAAVACEPLDFGTVAIDIGLSLGVAMVTADDTAADVIYRADRQMYAIKSSQRSLR